MTITTETTTTDAVVAAVDLLHRCRHQLTPDLLRSLADIWACASAARYGRPYEAFWLRDEADHFYRDHDVDACESEDQTTPDIDAFPAPVTPQ